MGNIIIIAILAVLACIGARETIKHFRGDSGCCGGSSDKPEKKKLSGPVIKTYIINIEGMHCKNCANTVTRAINNIEGATAKINLKKKIAKVSCDRDIDVSLIKDAINKHGYKAL